MLFALLAGACASLGVPAALPPLRFERDCFTQGFLGPERPTADYYRQDEVCLHYVLTGVRTDAGGEFDLTLAYKLFDPTGALVWQNQGSGKGGMLLGGGTLVGHFELPLDHPYLPPGEWKFEVVATDNASKQSATLDRKFRYKPLDLAVVRPMFAVDDQFKVPARPTAAIANVPLHFRGKVVGFALDRGTHGSADLEITIHYVDADGHDLGKPFEMHMQQKAPEPITPLACCDFNATLVPNRAGKFTIRVVAHDKVAKKTATLDVPLHVQE
jgi:hypothetical protein